MSEAKDALLRLITLPRLIPREPRRNATTLQEKLKNEGFSISLRCIQRWPYKARSLPNGNAPIAAHINPQVWEQAPMALLENKQLRICYLSRSKAEWLIIHPAGLTYRHSIGYLFGSIYSSPDVRQFALHRIRHAECLDTPPYEQAAFEIDHYIISKHLNTALHIEQTELVGDVSPQIAWLLAPLPLSTKLALEPWRVVTGNACAPGYRKTRKRFGGRSGSGRAFTCMSPNVGWMQLKRS